MAEAIRAPRICTTNWRSPEIMVELPTGKFLARTGQKLVLVDLDAVPEVLGSETTHFDATTLQDTTGTLLSARGGSVNPLDAYQTSHGLLMAVQAGDNKFFLYKSIDGGVSWGNNSPSYNNLQPVDRIGYYNGTLATGTDEQKHTAWIGLLPHRGIVERTTTRALYMVEYRQSGDSNINTAGAYSFVNGDQILLKRSTNGGDSWQIVWEHNTVNQAAGTSNLRIRHFHNIYYHKGRDLLLIGYGDRQWDSGYIVWQPDAAWPANNCTIPEIYATPGFSGKGGDMAIYNATDFVEIPGSDWVIHVTDGNMVGGGTQGLHRFRLSDASNTFENVYAMPGGTSSGRLMAYGARLPDGTLCAVEYGDVNNPISAPETYLYTSTGEGKDWKRVAVVKMDDGMDVSSFGPKNLFADSKGRLIWVARMAGSKSPVLGNSCSIIAERVGVHGRNDDNDILHPVWFVDSNSPNKVDSRSGRNDQGCYPNLPYATVRGCMSGGVSLTQAGGRIQCGRNHSETVANWIISTQNPNLSFPDIIHDGSTQICGWGMDLCTLAPDAAATYVIQHSDNVMMANYKDLTLLHNATNTTRIFGGTVPTRPIKMHRVRIGSRTAPRKAGRFLVTPSLPYEQYDCEVLAQIGDGTTQEYPMYCTNPTRTMKAVNTLFWGGSRLYSGTGCTWTLHHCEMIGQWGSPIHLNNAGTYTLDIRNNVFDRAGASGPNVPAIWNGSGADLGDVILNNHTVSNYTAMVGGTAGTTTVAPLALQGVARSFAGAASLPRIESADDDILRLQRPPLTAAGRYGGVQAVASSGGGSGGTGLQVGVLALQVAPGVVLPL